MYPTQSSRIKELTKLSSYEADNDDTTIVASNCSKKIKRLEYANAIAIAALHAIADTGATSIFIMKGTPVKNLRRMDNPITVSLPDSTKVKSTNVCDINVPGLPTTLMGHIVPSITMASLIGIRILCKAECKVVFNNEKCKVFYDNNIILRGYKDPSTDLWTLPITHDKVAKTTQESLSESSQKGRATKRTQQQFGPSLNHPQRNSVVESAGISYVCTTKINNVKFAHQSFCNPPIASLLKAINVGFLNGAPHLDAHTVRKYLIASPVTAKGHLKGPRKGIRSTTPKPTLTPRTPLATPARAHDTTMPGIIQPGEHDNLPNHPPPNIINEIEDESIANVFCFGAFADKVTGIVYNDCTGYFPYMSLDGNVCFFEMYHYEKNAILITPIAG